MKARHLLILVHVGFAAILIQLFFLQVIRYSYYAQKSERNRIRPVILDAPRGLILDRQGRELVSNRIAFDCFVVPNEAQKMLEPTLAKLSQITAIPVDKLRKEYDKKKRDRFSAIPFIEDLDKEKAIRIEENTDEMPGIFVETRSVRNYLLGAKASHVLGYLGAIGPEEYGQLKSWGYRMTDWRGRTGLEKVYEGYLRGKKGAWQFEADSRGRVVRALSIEEPEEGMPLQTTLDLDLQTLASELMKDQKGAVVVMDLSDGGILAMVSSPAFDPNALISKQKRSAYVTRLLKDLRKPLINRPVAGEYPPGSTFKIVTSFAGLKSGVIKPESRFFCPGSFFMGSHGFKCWRAEGHGSQNVVEALEHSCNVYFYNLGAKLGPKIIAQEAKRFGYGETTGIDLDGEKKGTLPSPEWKSRVFHENWYPGETVIYAIGQGYLSVTPLQVLMSASLVALDGDRVKPYLVRRIGDVDIQRSKLKRMQENSEWTSWVRKGMRQVVQSPTGTGQRAKAESMSVSGKTGTAQSKGHPDHAWFVGFGPSERPRVSCVVFLEHGGKGGLSAANIAGKLFQFIGEKKLP